MAKIDIQNLEGKKVGVIAGTSHEAYLKAMFTDAELKSYPNDDALRLALRRSEVDFIFGDAISLAFWINGTDSAECCAFSGGPFVESRYFGEGIGIAVRKGNDLLRTSLNWALWQITRKRNGKAPLLSIPYFTLHDFRRTVSTLLHEMGYAPHVIEKSLGHVVKGVAGIYNKAAYIDERRTMLQQWGDYLEGLSREKVVPLRRSGKAA